jgi:flagellar biosynthesis protein FlhB
MEEDESQKTHEPTQHKLDEARKKGDVPKSQDIATLFVMAAAAAVLLTFGLSSLRSLMGYVTSFLERPHEIAVTGGALTHLSVDIVKHTGFMLLAAFGAMSVAALAGHMGQTGLLVTGEKMKPKLDKISPIAGFKRLFGAEALMQFGKTVIKLTIIAVVAWMILAPHVKEMQALVNMEPAALMPILVKILIELSFALILVIAVGALADYFIQRFNWLKRNRMSFQEMKDEYKNTEGDPLVKAKLRQIRMERGRQRMMANVPNATVVITNPTHYAVALKYEAGVTGAPICVAKGVDRVALKIREVATDAKVPIIEDPPLARALFASVDIDDVIPAEHFQAVAKIIGVILSLAARRKSGDSLKSRVNSVP